ncbi:MAG: PorT family protein [Bacteroidaceae bacterium]|jgi:hypothetical protein|nr:PorT family protein [Bacteroidaceae bacterium]
MKVKSIIAASLLMSAASAFAQREAGTLSFQPKIGMNIAYYTNAPDTRPRLGIAAGAELEYQIVKKFSVSGGLVYSWQGAKEDADTYAGSITATYKTDYINFPILANVYLAKGLAVKFGIQPAVNIKSSYELSTSVRDGSLSDVGININTFDFAIPVGLSYEFKKFVIDARYNIGVTRLVDGDDSKNRVAQITFGIKYDLFKRNRSK